MLMWHYDLSAHVVLLTGKITDQKQANQRRQPGGGSRPKLV